MRHKENETHGLLPAPSCLDCGAMLSGAYCSNCGQPDQSPIKAFPEFLRESLSEFFSLDGAQVRSWRALATRPGLLSVEYLEGRRTRFVHPVRLFLHVGVLSYLVISLIPTESALFGMVEELFGDRSSLLVPLAAAAIIPIGATAHWVALRKYRPLFLEHLVFVIHVATYSFLLAPIEGAISLAAAASPLLATAGILIAPVMWGVYWILALSRFNNRTVRQGIGDALRVYGAVLLLTFPALAVRVVLGFLPGAP
jgi:uncharacterized protein DUF3667